MKQIKNNISHTYIINKSKFICYLIKVNSIDEINENLEKLKIEYKDATHHCYAYILDNTKRFNDDNEPGGTAGMPILNVLENNELNHILCVVIRYFGGIKLGAGGLVRAYTKSVTEALEKTKIIDLVKGYKVTIQFSYDEVKKIDNILKDINIVDKSFDDKIIYTFLISDQEYQKIENNLNIIEKEEVLI